MGDEMEGAMQQAAQCVLQCVYSCEEDIGKLFNGPKIKIPWGVWQSLAPVLFSTGRRRRS